MKAVLVIDMPECCGKCKLMDEDYLLNRSCYAHDLDSINITDTKGGKPDWCPLRELPEKMVVCGTYPQPDKITPSYKIGWNACIDKILDN